MELGRLLLFYKLNNQTNQTDDKRTEHEKIQVCNHFSIPPSGLDRGERSFTLRNEGDNRLLTVRRAANQNFRLPVAIAP